MTKTDEAAIVLAAFQRYATRGSFRSLTAEPDGKKLGFRFTWIRDVPFRVLFDPARRTLTFVDLLPAIPARSDMDRALRAFVKERTSTAVPEHRRVDPRRVVVHVSNRHGGESIVFTFKTKDTDYAVRKAVHLAFDVLRDFLNDGRYVEYCVEHLNLNPEMA